MSRISTRTFEILESNLPGDYLGKSFTFSIMTLIAINVIAVILETVPALATQYSDIFRWLEIFSIIIFTTEYLLRIWSCTSNPDHRHPIVGRLRYALAPMTMIDLLAILPFYVPFIIPLDLRVLRALRLFRIFRLFKVGRYSNALKTLGTALRRKREELLISVFVVTVLLIISSTLMFYIEHEVQPDAFSSIPATMWWAVATLTTVGYGDIYPITILGKFLGSVIAFLGIGMFALPAGILASGFSEAIRLTKE